MTPEEMFRLKQKQYIQKGIKELNKVRQLNKNFLLDIELIKQNCLEKKIKKDWDPNEELCDCDEMPNKDYHKKKDHLRDKSKTPKKKRNRSTKRALSSDVTQKTGL